ncbi:MAG: hypothetical protein H0V51_23800 [Chloroflexi bacterium]|nr:hypothetical protein [Chloroflexota bacterium]
MMMRVFLLLTLLPGLLAGCSQPAGPGSVSGQIKAASPDGAEVRNIAGAQVVLRGARDSFTTVSNDGEASGDDADGSYNYRFERVPPGTYTVAVTPPAGSGLQPENDIPTLDVKADELFPQSVLLLPEGTTKPRVLDASELNPGEVGYVNGRNERVVYQGGGIDTSDLLLMYLLFRQPPMFGYGAPPVLAGGRRGSTPGAAPYRVDEPPRTTRTGQTVTQRPATVPGQGATRPGGAPASGPGPVRQPSNGSNPGGAQAPAGNAPAPGVNRPSSPPSQGVSRPSAPVPSGGGRSGGGRK